MLSEQTSKHTCSRIVWVGGMGGCLFWSFFGSSSRLCRLAVNRKIIRTNECKLGLSKKPKARPGKGLKPGLPVQLHNLLPGDALPSPSHPVAPRQPSWVSVPNMQPRALFLHAQLMRTPLVLPTFAIPCAVHLAQPLTPPLRLRPSLPCPQLHMADIPRS